MLHVIANQFTLTEFLLQSLPEAQRTQAVHMHPRRIKGVAYSLLKALDAWLPWRLPGFQPFPAPYLEALEALPSTTPVLIFGIENIKDLRLLRKHLQTRNISLFTWNPVVDYQQHRGMRELHLQQLKRLKFRMFTFDPGDAERFGLTLIPQVYRRVEPAEAPPPVWDIYFLGQDKGRFTTLRTLGEAWQAQGLRVHLRMAPEPHTNYAATSAVEVLPGTIDYQDNIGSIRQAVCLLEIVQKNQTGPTVRCMEALFFNKKLITNNLAILDQPFYHSSRIYVLGHDAPERLASFLNEPSTPIAQATLDAHDFPQWLARFEGRC